MQNIGTLHSYMTRRRSRLLGAGIGMVAGVSLLFVLLVGLFAERPPAVASPMAAAVAPAELGSLQAQLDQTTKELAALRTAADQMRTDLAGLREQRDVRQNAPDGRRTPSLRDSRTAFLGANPVLRPILSEQPLRRTVAMHHPVPRIEHVKTVVVDGVTYVQGREPHALALPLQ